MRVRHVALLLIAVTTPVTLAAARARPRRPVVDEKALALQLALDASHFAPGEIDARPGENTSRALTAWGAARCARGEATEPAPPAPLLVPYRITEQDTAGPFQEIPEDMMEKAALPALSYSSVIEAVAERFHTSPTLLQRINSKVDFVAGAEIQVPNVERPPLPKAARVVVDSSDASVSVLSAQDCVLARYPATMGSENDPLPVGTWKVTEKRRDPPFLYNPDLFWDADPAHSKAKLPPGPNNPVGVAWIGLSKKHYGIHGTPEPAHIAKTQSHGCIRLTNWDAIELHDAVAVGTVVVLQE